MSDDGSGPLLTRLVAPLIGLGDGVEAAMMVPDALLWSAVAPTCRGALGADDGTNAASPDRSGVADAGWGGWGGGWSAAAAAATQDGASAAAAVLTLTPPGHLALGPSAWAAALAAGCVAPVSSPLSPPPNTTSVDAPPPTEPLTPLASAAAPLSYSTSPPPYPHVCHAAVSAVPVPLSGPTLFGAARADAAHPSPHPSGRPPIGTVAADSLAGAGRRPDAAPAAFAAWGTLCARASLQGTGGASAAESSRRLAVAGRRSLVAACEAAVAAAEAAAAEVDGVSSSSGVAKTLDAALDAGASAALALVGAEAARRAMTLTCSSAANAEVDDAVGRAWAAAERLSAAAARADVGRATAPPAPAELSSSSGSLMPLARRALRRLGRGSAVVEDAAPAAALWIVETLWRPPPRSVIVAAPSAALVEADRRAALARGRLRAGAAAGLPGSGGSSPARWPPTWALCPPAVAGGPTVASALDQFPPCLPRRPSSRATAASEAAGLLEAWRCAALLSRWADPDSARDGSATAIWAPALARAVARGVLKRPSCPRIARIRDVARLGPGPAPLTATGWRALEAVAAGRAAASGGGSDLDPPTGASPGQGCPHRVPRGFSASAGWVGGAGGAPGAAPLALALRCAALAGGGGEARWLRSALLRGGPARGPGAAAGLGGGAGGSCWRPAAAVVARACCACHDPAGASPARDVAAAALAAALAAVPWAHAPVAGPLPALVALAAARAGPGSAMAVTAHLTVDDPVTLPRLVDAAFAAGAAVRTDPLEALLRCGGSPSFGAAWGAKAGAGAVGRIEAGAGRED